MKSWKYALIAALLPASLWAATVRGQVRLPGAAPFTGVVGVKVVLTSGNSTAPHVDSAISDSLGNYIMNHGATAGARTVITTKSGYTGSVNLVTVPTAAGDTGTLIFNPIVSVNNKTSNFTGVVKRASDSSLIIGAIVTLTGGPDPAVNLRDTTDSTGAYRFDSVSTGGVYTLTATATNYTTASVGSLNVGWNSTVNAPTFYLTQNLGTLAGVVVSAAAGNPAIAGAKVVVSVGGVKVDSTTTNASGQYTLTLNAATYAVVFSAAGYRDSLGNATRTLTAAVTFGSTTNLNTTLTQATSTVSGNIRQGNATTGAAIPGATVYLERKIGTATANPWLLLDSTVTDASGIYVFTGLIASTGGTTATSTNYRIRAFKLDTIPNPDIYYGTSATVHTPVASPNNQGAALPVGGTITLNVALNPGVPIWNFAGTEARGIRFSLTGDRLALDLGVSNVVRTVSIFSLNGTLQHSVSVAAGESHTTVPATFAKGFLFQVK